MEEAIAERCGFTVTVKNKPMKDKYELPDGWEEEKKGKKKKQFDPKMLGDSILISDGENESSRVFMEMMGNDLRRCGREIFVRVNGGLWAEDEKVVDNIMLDRALSANMVTWNSMIGIMKYSANLSTAMKIIKATKARLPDSPNFIDDLWESNKGKLLWQNGCYDWATRSFSEDFGNVMSVIQVNRTFPSRRNKAMEDEVQRRVLDPILGEQKQPFLHFLARAMAGHIEDKRWAVLLGERDSGKGVLAEAIISAFGDYVTTMNVESLMCHRLTMGGGDEEAKLKFLFAMEHARLAITNEMKVDASNKDMKMDGNIGKKLTSGGDYLMARKLYHMPRKFRIQATLLMNCNDFPKVDPADFTEKVVPFSCPHKFTTNAADLQQYDFYRMADDSIKEWCRSPEVGDALFWIVADSYSSDQVELTPSMKQFKDHLCVDDEIKKVMSFIQITGNDKDLVPNNLIKDRLDRAAINMSLTKFYHVLSKRGNIKPYRTAKERGYTGIRLIEENRGVDTSFF
jgi:hypothetical protein